MNMYHMNMGPTLTFLLLPQIESLFLPLKCVINPIIILANFHSCIKLTKNEVHLHYLTLITNTFIVVQNGVVAWQDTMTSNQQELATNSCRASLQTKITHLVSHQTLILPI